MLENVTSGRCNRRPLLQWPMRPQAIDVMEASQPMEYRLTKCLSIAKLGVEVCLDVIRTIHEWYTWAMFALLLRTGPQTDQ